MSSLPLHVLQQPLFWILIVINLNLHLSLITTINPSIGSSPTTTPSIAPLPIPTKSPSTASPTTPSPTTPSPTIHPTEPTESPSNAPTSSPSLSPTASPTRHPTTITYPNIIYIAYNLTNITKNISTQLHDPNIITDMETNIEGSYLLYSRRIIDDEDQYFHFKDFHLLIADVITKPDTSPDRLMETKDISDETDIDSEGIVNAEKDVENIDSIMDKIRTNYSALLAIRIYYMNASVGTDIRFISKQEGFRNFTQYRLERFFDYYHIFLLISRPFEKDDGNKHDGFNIIFIFSIVIGFFCVSLGIVSFIYNNLVPNSKTDNGNSIAVPLYGLQVVDLFSDVNLCVEMVLQFSVSLYHPRRMSLYIAASGSLIFTIIPYVTNMIMAVGVKNIEVIKNNPFAKSYFQTTSWFFIVLVVFSGGLYPGLSIVSSRLLAFEFLNSGLSSMELTKLTKVRFFATILLENIPQLCCSIIYIHYRGSPSPNTILALIMSVLQVLAAVLNYIAMRIPNDCHVIEYDLKMKVGEKLQSQYFVSLKGTSNDILDEITTDDDTDQETQMDDDSDELDMDMSTLSKPQKQQIRDKKERKASLRRWLCTELSLRLNAVEIGYVTLTPNGCIVHMIHYTFESEAMAFRDAKLKKYMIIKSNSDESIELQTTALKSPSNDNKPTTEMAVITSNSNNNKERLRWDADDKSFISTAKSFLKDLYQKKSNEVNCAFASHFGFKPEEITVIFHKKYRYSSWAMTNKFNFSYAQLRTESMGEVKFDDVIGKGVPKIGRNESASADESHESKTIDSRTMSIRSDELQQGMDEMQMLTKKIKDKLLHKHEDEVREELLVEGYDGVLIDKMMSLGKLMATVRVNDSSEDVDKLDNNESELENDMDNVDVVGEDDQNENVNGKT